MSVPLTFGPRIDRLLHRLYSRSAAQEAALVSYFTERAADESVHLRKFDDRTNEFLKDKLVALDRPKAEFCYHLCRALQARRVVEAGTSFGVSTLFLAAAVRDNLPQEQRSGAPTGARPVVIATEYEHAKAAAALRHFAEAGLSDFIELREGDLRETLRAVDGPIDFVLIDIWASMARPALELVTPHLREGAVVICDNTQQFSDAYADYFAFVRDPRNGLRTMTLPFEGGLEFTVRASKTSATL
jgi:predicted O-methyltransferase YrrM